MERLTIRNSDGSVSQPTSTTIQAVFDKLAAYEDLEEQGRLVVLPCKVGDVVYCIRKKPYVKGRYIKGNIALSITLHENSISIFSTLEDTLGKTVFLTRAEAEKAMEGDGKDG